MSDLKKRCVECGTQVPTISDTPLCSKDCQIDYAHRMVRTMSDDEAWCPSCHKNFDSVKSVCYHHNKKHSFNLRTTKKCRYCDASFIPSNTSNPSKYCSESCFGKDSRKERFEIECKNCGNIYKSRRSESKFCSEDCYLGSEYNPFWDGGSSDIRTTPEYIRWRQTIHKKYNSCEKCGATENLHAHHIVPVSENENMATDVDNGVLLCGACHSEEHPNMPKELFSGEDK